MANRERLWLDDLEGIFTDVFREYHVQKKEMADQGMDMSIKEEREKVKATLLPQFEATHGGNEYAMWFVTDALDNLVYDTPDISTFESTAQMYLSRLNSDCDDDDYYDRIMRDAANADLLEDDEEDDEDY